LNRNFSQVFFLTVKGLVLASPLLIAGYITALRSRASIKQFQLWLIYAAYNVLFYYVIFDFSNRTLERYLMFMIIPGAIFLGVFLEEYLKGISRRVWIAWGSASAIFAVATAWFLHALPYQIFPLNPKSNYIQAVKHFDLNFLLPITGGSGPIGFYVLVAFVFVFFVVALVFLGIALFARKQTLAGGALIACMVFGLVYNTVLSYEMITGNIYGSPDEVTKRLVTIVNQDANIPQVITYYDIAGYELHYSGKYFKRFYTDPIFADTNVGKFADYSGYYMITDFPQIDKQSVYWKYFQTCRPVYKTTNKDIAGYIFDCAKGDASMFTPTSN
jgi:hypothetical protein